MNSLPQFRMNADIMLHNLRPKATELLEDPSNKPNIVGSVSLVNNSDLLVTQTKQPILGDCDSRFSPEEFIQAYDFEVDGALKTPEKNRNQLNCSKLNRV